MALGVTDLEILELLSTAQRPGEQIYQSMALGEQYNVPRQIGEFSIRRIHLRGGLKLEIWHGQFWQMPVRRRQHEDTFPITAKFYLSGGSRVRTPQLSGINPDYEEMAGQSYLYHLPDLTETEEWPANKPLQVVTIYATVDYFRTLSLTGDILPHLLQRLMQDTWRFHQPLGKMTPAMILVLQQILQAPYQSATQRLYLESKALELLSLQLAALEADLSTPQHPTLKTAELERVQYARDILVERMCDPPSFTELVRLSGLNGFNLKQGFHQLFGTTVFGYLYNYRMEQAQQLLHGSSMTIAQVAAQVGYRNPGAFSTAFRRKFAVSPKAYQLCQRR